MEAQMKLHRFQQGDVQLETSSIPKSAKRIKSLVVREGETTGHKHVLVCDNGTAEILREEKGDMYVRVLDGSVTLTHEEHGPIVLPKGDYKILPGVFEYEYESEESKRVID
jgi:uncharacterized cupin superfamily protein